MRLWLKADYFFYWPSAPDWSACRVCIENSFECGILLPNPTFLPKMLTVNEMNKPVTIPTFASEQSPAPYHLWSRSPLLPTLGIIFLLSNRIKYSCIVYSDAYLYIQYTLTWIKTNATVALLAVIFLPEVSLFCPIRCTFITNLITVLLLLVPY